MVRYKSFSLPPHYRHYYRQISFYRSRKSPTFVTDKSPTFVTDIYKQVWAYKLHYKK